MSDMEPWGLAHSRRSKPLSSPHLPQNVDKCLGLAGVSEPMKTAAPLAQGAGNLCRTCWRSGRVTDVCGQCRRAGGAGSQDSFRKLLGRMTLSRAAAGRLYGRRHVGGPLPGLVSGSVRLPWVRLGGVGHVQGAELHLPGELCGQARAGRLPHRSQRRLHSQRAASRPPAPDTVLIASCVRTGPRDLSEARLPPEVHTLPGTPELLAGLGVYSCLTFLEGVLCTDGTHSVKQRPRRGCAMGAPVPGRQEGSG